MTPAACLARKVTGRAPARLLTVLLLLVAVGMLVAPATAQATVHKKHARAYRIIISTLAKAKNIDVKSYNALDRAVVDTAENIKEILASDPVDRDALLNEEARAAELMEDADKLIAEPEALQAQAAYFSQFCKKWFDRGDLIDFRQGLHNIDVGADHVITAYMELGSVCEQLSIDPPSVEKAREYNAKAIAAVKRANLKFDKGFKQLLALRWQDQK
jgi:hypothetical protein